MDGLADFKAVPSLDWSGQRSCPSQGASLLSPLLSPLLFLGLEPSSKTPKFRRVSIFPDPEMQIRLAGLDEHVRSRRFFVFRPSRAFPNFSARASSDRRWPPSSFPAPPSLIIPLFPYFFVRGSISERDAWSFVQRNRIVVAVHSRSTRSWKRVEIKKEEREKMKICREKLFEDWTLLIYTRGGIFWARVDYWMDIERTNMDYYSN